MWWSMRNKGVIMKKISYFLIFVFVFMFIQFIKVEAQTGGAVQGYVPPGSSNSGGAVQGYVPPGKQ